MTLGFCASFSFPFGHVCNRRQQQHSAEAAAARVVDVPECVAGYGVRLTVSGSVCPVASPGGAYDRAGPTPSFFSTNLTRALRSVSVDECDEALAICVLSLSRTGETRRHKKQEARRRSFGCFKINYCLFGSYSSTSGHRDQPRPPFTTAAVCAMRCVAHLVSAAAAGRWT